MAVEAKRESKLKMRKDTKMSQKEKPKKLKRKKECLYGISKRTV